MSLPGLRDITALKASAVAKAVARRQRNAATPILHQKLQRLSSKPVERLNSKNGSEIRATIEVATLASSAKPLETPKTPKPREIQSGGLSVQNLSGIHLFNITVAYNSTVGEVKAVVATQTKAPQSEQRLWHG